MGGQCFPFVAHVIRGKWFAFYAAMMVMIGSGTSYVFNLYNQTIQDNLGYDEVGMSTIDYYKVVGTWLAVFNGLIVELIPAWFGLFLGATMNFGGYFMAWLAVTRWISRPKVWQMCLYLAVATNSPNFSGTIAMVNSINNFPMNRGVIIGLLKSLVGLSGATMSQLYHGIYGNDAKDLILLCAWLPASVSIIFMFTIRNIAKIGRQPHELKAFLNIFYLTILLALFLMVVILLEKYMIDMTQAATHTKCAITMTVTTLLLLPLIFVVKEEAAIWKRVTVEKLPQVSILPADSSSIQPKENSFANILINKPERGEDHTILQAILSVDMLYILLVTLCGYGPALTFIEQLRPIGVALEYHERLIQSIITLTTIWNYYGRVYSGFVSELLLTKWKLSRSIMMSVILLLECSGLILVAFPKIPGTYYVASVIIGFSFGSQVSINLSMTSELFGLKHYATFLNFIQTLVPLSLYLMNTKLTKVLYAREATKYIPPGIDPSTLKDLTCTGQHCFMVPFSILAAIAFIGALVSLRFARKTREFYQGDIYKRFRFAT
ncbi:uncharacterized protein LOC132174047 [Corylus avellana]|uniref:uncharacterized protein LOC132174047 n=1 Tax=Corylus avellana TaxID=13451 RepID=UPI00286D372F|nr:uncharacterized protein LOC132174047 [Corylus avellana]